MRHGGEGFEHRSARLLYEIAAAATERHTEERRKIHRGRKKKTLTQRKGEKDTQSKVKQLMQATPSIHHRH